MIREKLRAWQGFMKESFIIPFNLLYNLCMAVGTGGGGLAPPLFRDVKKNSMVKMHLNDANWV